jgi:hypothetical protein
MCTLRLAFNIARRDGLAIRRASGAPQALLYGLVFNMISAAIIFLVTALPGMRAPKGAAARTIFWLGSRAPQTGNSQLSPNCPIFRRLDRS